jgi:hypothetical protein
MEIISLNIICGDPLSAYIYPDSIFRQITARVEGPQKRNGFYENRSYGPDEFRYFSVFRNQQWPTGDNRFRFQSNVDKVKRA